MIKIAILVAVALLLFALVRRLSAGEPSYVPGPPPPPRPDAPDDHHSMLALAKSSRAHALVGADLPFPIPLPPITQGKDGRYSRPNILNYFFSKIDLVDGPADPRVFCDDFFIEIQNPADGHAWTVQYAVATPSGLQQALEAEASSSLYFEDRVIIVARWDLTTILQTVTAEIIKHWGDTDEEPASPTPLE